MRTPFVTALLLCASLSPAWAGNVPIKSVTASSYYTESGNYAPERIADHKVGTSWVEGDPGSGLGAWVELDLGGEFNVSAVRVWAGDWYSHDSWTQAGRPKEIELKFSDGTTELKPLTDKKSAQLIEFTPRKTSKIRIRLKAVYSGTTWSDTGISEVQVVGDAPSRGHDATLKGSSTAPEDGDGSYVAANAADDNMDTMWCEGNKASDGKGETLSFDFGSAKKISTLSIINGMGNSLSLWMKSNRATTATLTFSDGSSTEITLKGTMKPQDITFPAVTTTSVKMTFTGITAGKEFNDLCVSEAWFTE